MKQFGIAPQIYTFESVKKFCRTFSVGKGDLLLISASLYETYFQGPDSGAAVVHYRKYAMGEPTDQMVERMYEDISKIDYQRVIAVGGGTILDVAKLFALETVSPIVDVFQGKIEAKKTKELILIPTTCGTGSEVTNISILELTSIGTKMGLAKDELYADSAVLIPELLEKLPLTFFATSSIDALIHAMESFTSPKANPFTQMYSLKAMELLITIYQIMVKEGMDARKEHLAELLLASTYAGIAFGNAGCAAVHAMSYPLGATYHVPHGEANYVFLTSVYKEYRKRKPAGEIQKLNKHLAKILKCDLEKVYEALEILLSKILPKKKLHEYGVREEDIDLFTEIVMTKQGRLMANNYTELNADTVKDIYKNLF